MKTQLFYVFLVMTFICLIKPTASVASPKLRLRKKGLENWKFGPKPAFKRLSPRSMRSWARSERKRRRLNLPKRPLLKLAHQAYRNDGVHLSIGKPLHNLTKSELVCYNSIYNNDLLKDLKGNPNQAAARITLTARQFLARGKFKSFSRTPRLYMLTLGTTFKKEFLKVNVNGATNVELPPSSWHWNETAKQYQALCTIGANQIGEVTFDVVCGIESGGASYYGWFHHLQVMLVE